MRWSEEEISAFVDETDTGEVAYYYPLFGMPELRDAFETGIEISLNFQEPFLPVDLNSGVFEQVSPSGGVRPSDVSELMNGDFFLIRNAGYFVSSFEPDGSGFWKIKFSKKVTS